MAIRRIRAAAAATVLALSLGLTACSSDDDATTGPSGTSTSSPTDVRTNPNEVSAGIPTECTDPLADAKKGDVINGRELMFCQSEALGKIDGYVLTRVQGEGAEAFVTNTSRVNIDPLAVEIVAPGTAGADATVVLIGGRTYVKMPMDDNFVEVTENTTDESLVQFAQLPSTFVTLLNPKLRAAGTSPTLMFTVVGTDKVDGVDVTVVEAILTEGSTFATQTDYIDSRYLPIKSVLKVAATKEPDKILVNATTSMTEIDKSQHIVDPQTGK